MKTYSEAKKAANDAIYAAVRAASREGNDADAARWKVLATAADAIFEGRSK